MVYLDKHDFFWVIKFSKDNTQIFSQFTKIVTNDNGLTYFLYDKGNDIKINLSKEDGILIDKLMNDEKNSFLNAIG